MPTEYAHVQFVLAIPLPTAMQEFTDAVAPMLKRINHNIAESRTLAELRDELLPKLLAGEWRVPVNFTAICAALPERMKTIKN